MPYFKCADDVLCFLSEDDIVNGGLSLLPDGCIPITDEAAYLIQNPPATPEQILAIESEKLQGFLQLSASQKTALAVRIQILQDAIDNIGIEGQEEFAATPEEELELPVRKAQLTKWKNYSIALGRVTGQAGWPSTVVWPVQPTQGMDLTVSAVTAPLS